MPPPARRPGEHELSEGMRLLDRYTILDKIGSGGMATIYRATDDRLDRVVCVKLLRTTLIEGSGSTSGRAVYEATYSHFLKEALALSKLQHPNTLRIYDFGYLGGTEKGAPFHVSEYLDGGNIETHVRLRGPVSNEETLSIMEAVSGAIAEAHEHNIIHRDIKPSNILFARVRGELVPKLADFGIAHSDIKKKERDDVGESMSTVALFSPRWAAPEQLCGSPEGPRTDVYAMGLLLVFMLAGGVLFGDDDVRVTFNDRVRGDSLVTNRLTQLGFTGEIKRVLMHAMTARPEDRIATAPELYEALRTALQPSPPSSPQGRAPAQEKRGPMPPRPPALPTNQISSTATTNQIAAPPKSTLALEIERGPAGEPIQAPERSVMFGDRLVRYVQVHERLDLSFLDKSGGQVRVRVTMLPGAAANPTLNVKGLNCFVSKKGGRPTPATSVSQDGVLELVSSARETLGEISWSFGRSDAQGRAFLVDGRQLLVPYSEAQQAVAVMLSGGQDIVIMCRS